MLEKPDGKGGWTQSDRGPIGTYVSNLAVTRPDWLELDGLKFEEQPGTLGEPPDKNPKKPRKGLLLPILIGIGTAIGGAYLAWRFIDNIINQIDITDVTLTISTFPQGEGLLPEESDFVVRPLPDGLSEDKIKKVNDNGVEDYNPNRVMTAKWTAVNLEGKEGLGYWEFAGERIADLVPNNKFPFMEMLNLTAGQTYYWGVRAKSQKLGEIEQNDGQFRIPIQAPSNEPAPIYSSVTFITPEASAFDPDGFNKAATLKFEVIGGSDNLQIYLDDVFVKSNHLRFGIPTPQVNNPNAADRKEARYSIADYSTNTYKDELLIERPQYALSYNGDKNTANWASWVVNKTWLRLDGDPFKADKRNFKPDTNLPQAFHQVTNNDYYPQPEIDDIKYAAGHLVPVGDRDRPDNTNQESKNNLAISLFSNIVPQQSTHNGSGFWANIEKYARNFVKNSGYEVYVITGTDGIKQLSDGSGDAEIDRSEPIKIPEHLWRVLLVLDHPGGDVTPNTYTVGFWTENRKPTQEEKDWNEGDNWKTSTIIKTVNEIEKLTGYDFFSNISSGIQETIEKNREIFWNGIIPDNFIPNLGLSSPLMSEDVAEVKSSGIFTLRNINSSFIPTETTNDTAIGHNGVLENSIVNTDIDGSNQVSSMHISSFKNGILQIGSHEVSTPEVGTREVCGVEVNSIKVGTTEVSALQVNGTQRGTTEVSALQVSSSQVSIAQLGTFQIGIPQVGISQISVVENGLSKISASKISPSEVSTTETNAFKVNLFKVSAFELSRPENPFPSSIARDAKVVLDNVMLLNNDLTAPVANNDAATTNQTKPVTINILANDTDADSTINPATLAINTNPTNGIIQLNQDGTVTYTPNATFVGTDTFTYTLTDTGGLTSNTATVNITVNNIAPVITVITGDTTTTEGTAAKFTATATDPGDNIDYIWNFGDGTILDGEMGRWGDGEMGGIPLQTLPLPHSSPPPILFSIPTIFMFKMANTPSPLPSPTMTAQS